MQIYSVFRSIIFRFLPGKWVPRFHTVEGGSKNNDFFDGIWWHLLRVLLINTAIISDSALYQNLVLLREGWDIFIITHHSLKVTGVISSHEGEYKVCLLQGPYSLHYLSAKTKITISAMNILYVIDQDLSPPWTPSLSPYLPHKTY